jgi:hypothetical protein
LLRAEGDLDGQAVADPEFVSGAEVQRQALRERLKGKEETGRAGMTPCEMIS